MSKKLQVGILFGGRSGEHEISLRSANSIVAALDREKYDLTLLGIDPGGSWHPLGEPEFSRLTSGESARVGNSEDEALLLPRPAHGELVRTGPQGLRGLRHLDVVFPVLHGTFGEDGTVQGLLDLADVAYVGAGVLGSAVGMDKDVQKRLLRDAGIPIVPYVALTQRRSRTPAAREEIARLGFPLFVKPANLGSSVGIRKVDSEASLAAAIDNAFRYDTKIIVERGLRVREIEVAVLGNEEAEASVAGEICPSVDFYSYEAKYLDENGAALKIPAPLSAEQSDFVRSLAVRVFHLLEGSGMARVDFFLERESGAWYVNEVNTIPGFTSISMYPKLWEATGLSYSKLLDRLIELARERQDERRRLKRTFGED